MHFPLAQIICASELCCSADGPRHRCGVQGQGGGDFVQQFDGITGFAIHLVDERHDRDVAQAADFKQLPRACLDALGGVDDHNGGIDRRQRAVGVFRKILMARRVEQVKDAARVLKRHDRGYDGDAAVPFYPHPVGPGAAAFPLGADIAGKLNSAAGPQQMFGQCGLACVGMGDDRKGAAAGDLGDRVGHAGSWS